MLREDGSMVETGFVENREEDPAGLDPGEGDGEDEDLNSNKELVGDQNMCRLCGNSLDKDKRKMSKCENHLPRAFNKLYGIDVTEEQDFLPRFVHDNCSKKLQRCVQKIDKKKPVTAPQLARFTKANRKCTGCNEFNTGHNRAGCPTLNKKVPRKKRQRLLDLKNRDQGNTRCKEWYEMTQKFCQENGEELEDLLGFNLRRVLLNNGDKRKADILEKALRGATTGFEAFSPRTSLGRSVVSGRSANQFKDDWKFGKEHNKQIFANPGQVDLEKFRINQKNVSFKLTHGETTFDYIAPQLPSKPYILPGWKDLPPPDKKEHWKSYKKDLKTYKNLLRPSKIAPPSDLSESLRPNFYAVGNPYANILAFSLYDIRKDLLESLKRNPDLVNDGVLTVDVIGSDGCDGAAGYGMMSKPTERDIPDHALAYDFGITEVSVTLANFTKVVLYDSKKVSVYNLQPVLRAACNENDHYATHSLTIPIETARKYLGESVMEVKISDNVTLRTNSIEIVTSKLDKKYADEQGGTGEGNFPCNLCTSTKEQIRDTNYIKKGFAINRTCAEGHIAAETRRVNIDKMSQDKLKRKSKGWKSAPILSAEYVRRGFDDLHGCTSWGRWLVKIAIRLKAGIFSETITADLKPLYDTTKKILRDHLKRSIGIDIHMDLKGREAQALFSLKNSKIVEKIVPEEYEEEWCYFLTEARFALAIVCSPDPAQYFDLAQAEPRLKRFQLWLIQTWPSFIQPDYVHPTLMHTVQLLKGPGALKSISQYGTQNKEAKNKKNNEYLATMARMTDLTAALEDVYARDALASSVEIRQVGETHKIQHCSKCKELGHRAPNCGESTTNEKFVDLDSLDPVYKVRNKIVESESEDEPEDAFDFNSNIEIVTPRRRMASQFDDELDSPAYRTRSRTKNQHEGEPSTSEQAGIRRRLEM